MTTPIRIIIVDDHPVVRQGIRGMLDSEPDFEILGEATSGEEALDLVDQLQPNVVLMDLRMEGIGGVEATAHIAEHHPESYVLILTTYDSDADIVRAIDAGATGYLLKDTPRDELCRGVRSAARGEPVLAPPVAARLMQRMRAPAEENLSAREVEVLALVSKGGTNKDIARQLHISEATVKSHLIHIYEKLSVSDRTSAVTKGLELGIIRLDGAGG